jgi:hypothetical protein
VMETACTNLIYIGLDSGKIWPGSYCKLRKQQVSQFYDLLTSFTQHVLLSIESGQVEDYIGDN